MVQYWSSCQPRSRAMPEPIPLDRDFLLQKFDLEVARNEGRLFADGKYRDTAINSRGYRYTTVGRRMVVAHRVIWTMVFGEIPGERYIDHKNSDRTDNRVCNLQLLSRSANLRHGSTARSRAAKTQFHGIRRYKHYDLWQGYLIVHRKWFAGAIRRDPYDALQDRLKLELEHWGFLARRHAAYLSPLPQ